MVVKVKTFSRKCSHHTSELMGTFAALQGACHAYI